MPEPADTDWAYAAGIVDGEGCIAIIRSFVPKRGRYYYGVHVVVANRDRDVLAWMQSVWGGYVVVMIELLQRGKRTLGRAPLPQSWLDEQETHYWIQRELNHRGTGEFVKKPMHSSRQIHRIRTLAVNQAS